MDTKEALAAVQLYKGCEKKKAVGRIYAATLDAVYRYVYMRVGRKGWTEDIVSETYMTFIEIFEKYDGSSKIETFIIGIARNKIRQFVSKLQGTISYKDELSHVEDDVFFDGNSNDSGAYQLNKSKLRKVLSELSERYREVLELRFINALTIRQTAEEMKISESNARVLQHRALKKAADIANNLFVT